MAIMACTLLALLFGASQMLVAAEEQHPLRASETPQTLQHARFNPLHHLPGISPYFDAFGFGLEDSAPLGCNVTVASYLLRHGAIYANDDDYETFMEPIFKKIEAHRKDWKGPLSVLRNWQTPITDPDSQLEQLTPAGEEQITKVAHHLLSRYPHLVPTSKKVYSDKKSRTKDTVRAFIEALPQEDIELVQISEDHEFHAVTPHKACPAFTKKVGQDEMESFIQHYTKSILSRLRSFAPVELTASDIVGLQQWCGYESSITGKQSVICDIFTPTDWMGYEYAWDIKYSYMVGPQNPLSPYLGFPWLNETATLFARLHAADDIDEQQRQGSSSSDDGQRFFLSTTHREVPPLLATALGIFHTSSASDALPTDEINYARAWKMSELIPFLGHIGIEKMICDSTSGALNGSTEFVRVLANSAPRPIPHCQQGPGASCDYHDFIKMVRRGMDKYGDFHGVCNVTDHSGPIIWT